MNNTDWWELERIAVNLDSISKTIAGFLTDIPDDEPELGLELFAALTHCKRKSLDYMAKAEQKKEQEAQEKAKKLQASSHECALTEDMKNLRDTASEALNEIIGTASPKMKEYIRSLE